MSTETVPARAPRRDLWLEIVLAVARDNMPEPEISYCRPDYDDREFAPYMYLKLYSHAEAERWARQFGATVTRFARPELGTHYVNARVTYRGWTLNIDGVEDWPGRSPLADQVASATVVARREAAARIWSQA